MWTGTATANGTVRKRIGRILLERPGGRRLSGNGVNPLYNPPVLSFSLIFLKTFFFALSRNTPSIGFVEPLPTDVPASRSEMSDTIKDVKNENLNRVE
jgi:hypothetical protein